MLRENLLFSRPFYVLRPFDRSGKANDDASDSRNLKRLDEIRSPSPSSPAIEREKRTERIYRDSNWTTLVETGDVRFFLVLRFAFHFVSLRNNAYARDRSKIPTSKVYVVPFPFLLSTSCHLAISSSTSCHRVDEEFASDLFAT